MAGTKKKGWKGDIPKRLSGRRPAKGAYGPWLPEKPAPPPTETPFYVVWEVTDPTAWKRVATLRSADDAKLHLDGLKAMYPHRNYFILVEFFNDPAL